MTDSTAILRDTAHRPWPLPASPWIMFQRWVGLLFAHWPLPPDRLRPLVPAPLELETFDGSAWLGQTPFRIVGLRPRYLPPLPGVSCFPEMNLRTYVRREGKAGIFFFTLDAASRLAVAAARTFYRLPYRHAHMSVRRRDDWIDYRSVRPDGTARFETSYRPIGTPREPAPGTLEHFLTERYAMYAVLRNGLVLRGDIHHSPWPLQPAEARFTVNTVPAAHRIELPPDEPLLHYAAQQDTLIWPPVPS